jgi:seryl-tRNA synthetase
MSDTPRTDEISRGYLSVPVEWAKTLERELAEALEELKKANQYIATGRSWNATDSLLAEISMLKQQRDTLEEALENAEQHMRHKLYCYPLVTDGEFGCSCGMIKDKVAAIKALTSVKGGQNE